MMRIDFKMIFSLCIFLAISRTFAQIPNITTNLNNSDPIMNKYLNGTFLKTTPSLIPELSLNNTECLVNLRPIIGYFSDFEQALLLRAAKENRDSNRCFDCQFYFQNLPSVFERQMKLLSEKLSMDEVKRREALKCLFNIGINRINDANEMPISQSLTDQLMTFMYIKGETNQCLADFLSEIGRILFLRRRFLCAKFEDMNMMQIKDNSSGNILGFKWTDEEARNMTNSFVTLTQCVNKERYTLPQVIVNSINTLALSSNCSANSSLLTEGNITIPGTSPVMVRNGANMTGPVPNGILIQVSNLTTLNETKVNTTDTRNTTASTTNITSSTPLANATRPVENTTTTVTNATTLTGIPIIPQPASNITGPAIIMANTTGTNLTISNSNRTSATGPIPSGRLLLARNIRNLESNNTANTTNTTTIISNTTTNETTATPIATPPNNAPASTNLTTSTNSTATNASVTNTTTPVPSPAGTAPAASTNRTETSTNATTNITTTAERTNITTTNTTTPMGIPVAAEAVRNATIANATIVPTMNIPASPLIIPGTNIIANATGANVTRANASTTNVLFTMPLGTNVTGIRAYPTGPGAAFGGMRANLTGLSSTSGVSLAIPVISTVPGMTNVSGLTGINTEMGGSMSNLTGSATSLPILIPVALGPAIPALINNPRRDSSFLQLKTKLNMSSVNLTSFSLNDILPAISNNLNSTNLNSSNIFSLISNSSTPLVIRNPLDFFKADNDVYLRIKSVLESLINLKFPNTPDVVNDYKKLAYFINKKMLSNYEYNCLPNAHVLFLLNLKDGSNPSSLLKEFLNPQCEQGSDKNYIITLYNNTATCHNCPSGNILIKNFTYVDESKVPADYFISTACVNGRRIVFSYIMDSTGIPFINFSDGIVNNLSNVNNNFNFKCIMKAFKCSSDTGSDEYCPFNSLNAICKNELSEKCRESNLYKLIDTLKYFNTYEFVLPSPCNIGLYKEESQMHLKCLTYIFNTFLSGGMSLNADRMSNYEYERSIYSTPEKTIDNPNSNTLRLRFLQSSPLMLNATPISVMIVSKSDDPTIKDEIASRINREFFNTSVIVIDGVGIMERNMNMTDISRNYLKELGNKNNTSVVIGNSNREGNIENVNNVRRLSGSTLKSSLISLVIFVFAVFLF